MIPLSNGSSVNGVNADPNDVQSCQMHRGGKASATDSNSTQMQQATPDQVPND